MAAGSGQGQDGRQDNNKMGLRARMMMDSDSRRTAGLQGRQLTLSEIKWRENAAMRMAAGQWANNTAMSRAACGRETTGGTRSKAVAEEGRLMRKGTGD